MKNKKFRRILPFAALSFVACAFGACGLQSGDSAGGTVKKYIASPEVFVSNNQLGWTPVVGASAYEISFNDGAKTTTQDTFSEFPEEDGAYVLYLTAKGSGLIEDSKTTQFSFTVEKAELPTYQVANGYEYTFSDVENCVYRINGGEWQNFTSEVLTFNNAVANDYTVEYYRKGNGWNEANSTFVVDCEAEKIEFTVKEKLATPQVTFDSATNTLSWNAVENAAGYTVSVNGNETAVTTLSCTLPDEIGTYRVWVRADAATDDRTYISSMNGYYDYSVRKADISDVTVIDQTLYVDEELATHVETSTDGTTYVKMTGNSVENQSSLTLRVERYYDANTRVLYLQSDTLSLVKRSAAELTFDKSGEMYWGEADENNAVKYAYKIWKDDESEPTEYTMYYHKTMILASREAGTYNLKMYCESYLDKENGVLYTASDEITTDFVVLSAPKIEHLDHRLTYDKVDHANAYFYKSEDGDWQELPKKGAIITEKNKYYVYADGNSEQRVISSVSSILEIDPKYDTTDNVLEAKENELFRATTSTGGTESYCAPTYVADNNSPTGGAIRGTMQILSISFNPISIQEGDLIVFTYRSTTRHGKGGMYLNSISDGFFGEMTNVDAEADDGSYATTVYQVTAAMITKIGNRLTSIHFRDYSGNTDVGAGVSQLDFAKLEIVSVKEFLLKASEDGMVSKEFKAELDKYFALPYDNYLTSEIVEDEKSPTGYALKTKHTGQKYSHKLPFDSLEVDAGSVLKLVYRTSGKDNNGVLAGAGFLLNDVYKVGLTTNTEDYQTLEYKIAENMTLTSLGFEHYAMWSGYEIYIASIKITPPSKLTAEQLETGFTVTKATDNEYVMKVGQSSEVAEDAISESGYAIHAISKKQADGVTFNVDDVTLYEGDQVVVYFRGVSKNNKSEDTDTGIYLNGAKIEIIRANAND